MVDPLHVITPDDVQLKENLHFEVPPMSIIDRSVRHLRGKDIKSVKVVLNQTTCDVIWQREDHMNELYPNLFETA